MSELPDLERMIRRRKESIEKEKKRREEIIKRIQKPNVSSANIMRKKQKSSVTARSIGRKYLLTIFVRISRGSELKSRCAPELCLQILWLSHSSDF